MIQKFMLSLGFIVVLAGFAVGPASMVHAADVLKPACSNLTEAEQKKNSACNNDPDKNPLFGNDGLLNKITLGIAMVAGFVAIIFMIIGGYKMILSNSDKQAFTNGRNTLIYAAIGLIVIVIARALVSFVITRIG